MGPTIIGNPSFVKREGIPSKPVALFALSEDKYLRTVHSDNNEKETLLGETPFLA